jgi:hypothetical protein
LIHSPDSLIDFLDLPANGGNAWNNKKGNTRPLRALRACMQLPHLLIWFYAGEGSQGNGFSQEIGYAARSKREDATLRSMLRALEM